MEDNFLIQTVLDYYRDKAKTIGYFNDDKSQWESKDLEAMTNSDIKNFVNHLLYGAYKDDARRMLVFLIKMCRDMRRVCYTALDRDPQQEAVDEELSSN